MRISDAKPEFDKIDWSSLGIEDESMLNNIKDILGKPAQINSYMTQLYSIKPKGLLMKQIGAIFGCSESTVSLRMAGKVGAGEGVARKPRDQLGQYIQVQEAKDVCPHSEHLEETLLRFRVSPRRTQDIVLLYTDSYPTYDVQSSFYELLRANRISEKKARLIMDRFFLKDTIPDAIDMSLV